MIRCKIGGSRKKVSKEINHTVSITDIHIEGSDNEYDTEKRDFNCRR